MDGTNFGASGAGVAIPAVCAGAVVGVAVWLLTPGSPVVIGVLALTGAYVCGRFCYLLLK